jgi:nucleoid-associated protein YgaU
MLWSLRRVLGLRFAVVIIIALVVMLALKAHDAERRTAVIAPHAAAAPDDITGSMAPRPAAGGLVLHVVARNDSLWAIARRYGQPITDIARINRIARNAMVRPGDILVIPRG